MRLSYILSFLFLFTAAAFAEDAAAPAPAPQWYLDDIEFLTRDGGRWITSNADYQNEDEPFEAYGIEWEKAYAGSMRGRLFGVQDGEETGNFWQFFQYWDPIQAKPVLTQFGFGGAVGIGTNWPEDDANKSTQTFYAPDGAVTGLGHIAHNPDADTHVTESFDIVDGEWRPRRVYTWKRQPVENAADGE